MEYFYLDLASHFNYCYSGLFSVLEPWKHKFMLLPNYELMIGVSGSYTVLVNHAPFTVIPGKTLLIQPGETVVGTGLTEGHTSFWWIHFECAHSNSIDDSSLTRLKTYPQEDLKKVAVLSRIDTVPDLPKIEILLHQISAFKEENIYSELPLDLLTQNLLINISGYTTLRNVRSDEPWLVRQLKEWVRIRVNQNISLSDAAKEFHLSREHISRIFKKYTGETVAGYITKRRMEYAMSLISTGHYSIRQVASLTGYNDEKYFSHVFSRTLGIPPQEYKRALGKTNV